MLTSRVFGSLFTLGGFTVALFDNFFIFLLSFFYISFLISIMSSSPSLRKRGGKKDGYTSVASNEASTAAVASGKRNSEWDYWLAITVLTVLAFATRFWRIDYPNEVVFDEVHFGKVRLLELCGISGEQGG